MDFILVFFLLFLFVSILSVSAILVSENNIYAQTERKISNSFDDIQIYDSSFTSSLIVKDLDFLTTMDFLGPDDFLVLEKNTGLVKRITNGTLNETPLIHLNVSSSDERGLLGIAVKAYNDGSKNSLKNVKTNITHDVYLYYVECNADEKCYNTISKYQLDNSINKLVNHKKLISIPSFPSFSHVGGILKIGQDDKLYFTVGNFQRTVSKNIIENKAQNFKDGVEPDGRGGILRISLDGQDINDSSIGIIGEKYPLNLYYAYGIRNSFGIDFDPISGKLWDTENGPYFGDEINLVEPGFNSGADIVYGFWKSDIDSGRKLTKDFFNESPNSENKNPDGLVYLGKSHYGAPEFVWDRTIGPTALMFLNSTKYGSEYQNDMFVGSVEEGRIFHFNLNDNRTDLILNNDLADKIAKDKSEFTDILFADGFGIVTDLKNNPYDGYIYLVSNLGSVLEKSGTVFKILPK